MDNNDYDNIFKVPFLACCIAKRNSGKSFLTKYLVKYFIDNGQIDEVMAFTQTNDMNNEYDYLKKKYVFDRYDDDKMNKIMELQKKQIKKYGKESKKVKNILIILDDVIGSLDAYSPVIRRLITQGRHYNISLILNIQISKRELSTDFRANADIFIVGYNNRNTIKSLYEEFEFDGNLKDFINFIHKNTTDYNFVLYINKVMNTYDINKRYLIIKADDSDDLKNFNIK